MPRKGYIAAVAIPGNPVARDNDRIRHICLAARRRILSGLRARNACCYCAGGRGFLMKCRLWSGG
jgi:hypothetical protein